MSSIRSKNTKPEIILRKALWAQGFRFRKHYCKERIDIAFPAKKIAVFVDGCFWHGCPFHSHVPKTNIDYWLPKLKKNIERAEAKDERLQNEGWRILHFWEHELTDLHMVLERIRNEFV